MKRVGSGSEMSGLELQQTKSPKDKNSTLDFEQEKDQVGALPETGVTAEAPVAQIDTKHGVESGETHYDQSVSDDRATKL